jgi:hypothetical protein
VPALDRAYLLIESHDAVRPGCTETLRRRFASTHRAEEFVSRVRTLEDFPFRSARYLGAWAARAAEKLMWEQRSGVQHWLLLSPASA